MEVCKSTLESYLKKIIEDEKLRLWEKIAIIRKIRDTVEEKYKKICRKYLQEIW